MDSLDVPNLQVHKHDIYTLANVVLNMNPGYLLLNKMDSSGNLLWSKTIVVPGTNLESVAFLVSKKNQIYIGSGTCGMTNLILSFDSNGTFLWAKSYIQSHTSSGFVDAMKEDASGKILVLSIAASTINFGFYLFKIDTLGNVTWHNDIIQTTFSLTQKNGIDKVRQDNKKNVYFSANVQDASNNAYNFIFKFDSLGNYSWGKYYTPPSLQPTATEQIDVDTAGTIYSSSRFSPQNPFMPCNVLCKIDGSNGNVIQASINDTLNSGTYGFSCVKYVNNNEIILGGGTSNNTELTSVPSYFTTACQSSPITMSPVNASVTTNITFSFYYTYPTFTINNSGMVLQNVNFTRVADCYTTSAIRLNSNSKIELDVYPNPSNGNFKVTTADNIDELKVIDILGEIIYDTKPGNSQAELNIDKAGIYFIQVSIGNQITTQKIIVVDN